jgi:UDP-N-acetylmuramoyl-tripeptide--D-alanyl-D-alanine ligase
MRIEALYELYKKSYKVVKDTREDVNNCIYFSLKGDSFDGNKYAMQALNKGANYAIIDEKEYLLDDRMILVDDALQCLQELARYHRQQLNIPILALTGSNGKTTTKELINAVLQKKYNCYATKGNLNNHIGVPLTLLNMTPEHNFGVVEMGANHLNEIETLCNIALPDYGYITNFGRVHLEGFGSFEGVIRGKTEMYRHLKNRHKHIFVNLTDDLQMQYSKGMKRISFGSDDTKYNARLIKADPFVTIDFDGFIIKSNLIGAYNFSNIAAALTIGKYFEIQTVELKEAIESFVPSNNRSQIIEKTTNKIILDAYNANPNSMDAAVNNLADLSDKHKIAILGDMFEIGDDTLMEHQIIVDLLAKTDIDRAFLIGDSFYKTKINDHKIQKFKNYETFKKHLEGLTFQHSTLLIKASRGMALERVLELI